MFAVLTSAVRWHGPVFLEAVRVEERTGDFASALRLALVGLAESPKYGPLLFKVCVLFFLFFFSPLVIFLLTINLCRRCAYESDWGSHLKHCVKISFKSWKLSHVNCCGNFGAFF